MKKYLITLLTCLVCCIFVLSGCGGKATLSGGPATSDKVYGNGGTAVIKGNYLYFANTYTSSDDVDKNENKYGSETINGIYRTKLNELGNVNVDESGFPTDAELLVEQIGGFEQTNFYIFDNYLYYSTPKSGDDSDGNTIKGILVFHRIKLDGSNHKELYSCKNTITDYSMCQIGSTVHIILSNYDSTAKTYTLTNITISSSGKVSSKNLGSDFTGVILPEGTLTADSVESKLFITQAINFEKDGLLTGNKVLSINLSDNKTSNVLLSGKTYTLLATKNNRLYYNDANNVFSNDFNGTVTQYGANLYTNLLILDDQNGVDMGLVGIYAAGSSVNQAVFIKQDTHTVSVIADGTTNSKTYTIHRIYDNQLLYSDGSGLYMKNIYDGTSITIATSATFSTVYDIDEGYFFYFANVTDSNAKHTYLHIMKFDENATGQFLGKLAEDDIVVEDEDEE